MSDIKTTKGAKTPAGSLAYERGGTEEGGWCDSALSVQWPPPTYRAAASRLNIFRNICQTVLTRDILSPLTTTMAGRLH